MLRLLFAVIFLLSTPAWAAEDLYDTYYHAAECPESGEIYAARRTGDALNNFVRCQCTSYAAQKLSELMTARYYNNGAPSGLVKNFHNQEYYMPQLRKWPNGRNRGQPVTRWSDALYWRDSALHAEIGVTGARDNFTWDEKSYNAVFPGDVAWWDKWNEEGGSNGHVAIVESAGMDEHRRGVAWVTITEYNFNKQYDFSRRTLYKKDHPKIRFPDAFLHIDKDHAYCVANPTKGDCPALWGGRMNVPTGGKADGLGGNSDPFNLKVNDFWAKDVTTGTALIPGGHTVQTNQTLEIRIQAQALHGDTHDHMRPGKDKIEVDISVREDTGEWRFLKREYIRSTNLPNNATHTEHVTYVVPAGAAEVSFKAKIDAEDEAWEANEGDNWSKILSFTIDNNPSVNLTVTALELTNTAIPVPTGGKMGAKMAIRNTGTTAPLVGMRSDYSIRGPGTNNLRLRLADDGSDPQDLIPGEDHWEEIKSLVTAPTLPGSYELRGCADYQNAIFESNEGDNCLIKTFQVVSPLPDFIVTAVGPAGGSMSFKAGTKLYPAMYIKNIGNGTPTASIRSSYEYLGPATNNQWVYITDDGTDPKDLCPGCQTREQYDGGMKINQKGTYYFRGCANYKHTQVESDTTNNCTVSGAVTIY